MSKLSAIMLAQRKSEANKQKKAKDKKQKG